MGLFQEAIDLPHLIQSGLRPPVCIYKRVDFFTKFFEVFRLGYEVKKRFREGLNMIRLGNHKGEIHSRE